MQAFSAFNGESITGNWTLTVFDSYLAGDDGTLDAWSLELCTNPVVTGVNDELDEKSWIVHQGSASHVFEFEPDNLWKEVLKEMGGQYAMMMMGILAMLVCKIFQQLIGMLNLQLY